MEPLTDERLTLRDDFPPVSDEAWRARIEQDLRGADFDERLVWHTLDGFDVHTYYREKDRAEVAHDAPLRVEQPPVTVRQDVTAPTLKDAHRLARHAVERGAGALGIVPQCLTIPDGIPLQRVRDLLRLLDGIDLGSVELHLSGGPASLPLLALLLDVAEQQGVPRDALSGSIDFDPLAQGAVLGQLAASDGFDLLRGLLRETDALPAAFKLITVDAHPYHDAGASSAQELGCTIAALSETLARLTARGLDTETVARRVHLIVPVGTSYFMEIAKLRALRLLVQQVLSAYGLPAYAITPPVQATTSRWSETVYDPHVNMLRATTETAAALIGGCTTITVRPFDAAYAAPGDFSSRIARNTPLVLQHEAYLHRVADPAAGSYYVEQLTDKLGRAAWTLLQEIESQDGLAAALQAGTVQEQIRTVREQRLDDIALRRRVLLGTNQYPNLDEARIDDVTDADAPTPEFSSTAAVPIDPDAPLASLNRALADGATVADVVAALDPSGAVAIDPLPPIRGAEAFERLRLSTERHAEETGRTPLVFLLPVGKPAWRSARANFARNFFGCAGLAVQEHLGFDTPEEGADAALDAGADVVVVCSSDDEYADVAPAACERLLAEDDAPLVVVAGNPDKLPADDLRGAGVDAFIHLGTPLLEALQTYQERLGIRG